MRDEREAAKTAYCAAALNLVGAPLMILPALIGRHLLPDLIASHRTADTYMLLVITLLPAGMIGIIVAAMFSATMAVVSADFNAIASVLTKDVYHRLFRPEASDAQLLRIGRWTTLILGLITTALGLWIAALGQQSLFNTMVTLLGLFMAPTFLPLLAGLASRRLTARGALLGFCFGLVTGFTMLALKTWWLPLRPDGASLSTVYAFEGVSLLANAAATVLGLVIGTVLGPRDDGEARRAAEFFAQLDRPIGPGEVPRAATSAAMPVLGLSTIGVGVLLAVAGLLAGSTAALFSDLADRRRADPHWLVDQKLTFNANCMLRLSTMVVVMRPAFGLPMFWFGKPKPGWLNRLKASHRNSRFERPRRVNRFDSDASKLMWPGV